MSRRNQFIILCLFLIAVLIGCGPDEEELASQIAASVAETVEAIPTITPYPTSTPLPTSTSLPTLTPYPTSTSLPTLTPYPTYTPLPFTPTPTMTGVEEWLEGHFWSLKVVDVQTETDLDGTRPTEDIFVLVDVQWKANDLVDKHSMSGIDFELVDNTGEQYAIFGMIYESETFESYSANAEFQEGMFRTSKVRGDGSDTYRFVFDVPLSASGLKLWFQDFPRIDLNLELP